MGVNLTPTTVENALTNYTISPGPETDRFAIARQQLQDTIKNVLDPQFAEDQRKLNRYNFGAGRGVSGAARTSQGDLLASRDRDINQLTSGFLNPALTGSIEDAYRNIGIAQQQQGFQRGQQGDVFNQGMAQWNAGNMGDLTQIYASLLAYYKGDAAAAASAFANLITSGQQKPPTTTPPGTTTQPTSSSPSPNQQTV